MIHSERDMKIVFVALHVSLTFAGMVGKLCCAVTVVMELQV